MLLENQATEKEHLKIAIEELAAQSNFNVDQILTKEFIKKFHHRMMGDVWEWAGTFRKSNKNLGVDWTKIEIELRILLDDTRKEYIQAIKLADLGDLHPLIKFARS